MIIFQAFTSIDAHFEEVPPENNMHDINDDLLDSPITMITSTEVFIAIKELKNGKSAGADGIPAELFKVISDKFVLFLVPLFNKMFDLGCFPEVWAKSVISPIYKKGDRNLPTNYRGVCLQPVLSKIFTSVLNKRLKQWSIQHNVLGEEQAGFRSTYSTIDNLFCLQTVITKYLRQKGSRLYAIFVDFEKAFDRIDRSMLWNKLNTLNVSSKMVKMLRSIYSEVKYYVKCDTELTNYFNCMNGVRQGCAVSPILFCFFLNDLKDFVTVDSHGIDLNMCRLFLLLFADDLVMFADSKVELHTPH